MAALAQKQKKHALRIVAKARQKVLISMNTRKLLTIIGILVISLFIINELRFIFWGGFGLPTKGAFPNCGPEQIYKFDVKIESVDDFISFLQEKQVSDGLGWQFKLDDFRDPPPSEINWDKVRSAVTASSNGAFIFRQNVYTLKYRPSGCSGYTLKATSSGIVSIYGCCGI